MQPLPEGSPWWAMVIAYLVIEVVKAVREHLARVDAKEDRERIEAHAKAANVLSGKTLAEVARTGGSPVDAIIEETNRELDRALNTGLARKTKPGVIEDAKRTAVAALGAREVQSVTDERIERTGHDSGRRDD
jgi:hypothetical protein